MILNELSLPYKCEPIETDDLHTPRFEKYNPNGRVPAIIDPNNGDIVLWETGAIIEYLIDEYDKEGKISFKDGKEKYEEKQWLYFQASGQGPYFGQAIHFMKRLRGVQAAEEKEVVKKEAEKKEDDVETAEEKARDAEIQVAITRYKDEAERITKVRNDYLRDNKKEYLVGNKCTYADIAFFPWDLPLYGFIGPEEEYWKKKYPEFWAWNQRLRAREAVQKTLGEQAKAIKKFEEENPEEAKAAEAPKSTQNA